MLAQLIKVEWRQLSADRSTLAAALLLGAAIAYGAYNGAQWVRFQNTTLAAAQAEETQRLAAIRSDIPKLAAGEKKVPPHLDPRSPAAFGRGVGARYAVMPPAPLAALAIGQSDLYPYYFKVSTGSKQTFLQNDEIENPTHLLAGRFDLAFVILYLFPLVILALSYNLVSAEKESGTLAMTLSQPVRLRKLVLAKVAVRGTFLAALALGLSIIGVALGGADLSAGGAGLHLLFWVAIVILYGAFWFALAVAVNALGVWLVLVIVVPSFMNVAVKSAYPVPSRVELIQAIRVAGDAATREGSLLLARYLEDHPEMAPAAAPGSAAPPDFYALNVAVTEQVERKVQPVLDHFDRQVANQQAMIDRLRFLSPAIVAQSALNDLAGSSAHRYQHFLAQADTFHREWRAFFNPRILRKAKLSAEEVGELPQFRFQEEPDGAVTGRFVVAFAGLLAAVGLVAIPGLAALRSYPVAG